MIAHGQVAGVAVGGLGLVFGLFWTGPAPSPTAAAMAGPGILVLEAGTAASNLNRLSTNIADYPLGRYGSTLEDQVLRNCEDSSSELRCTCALSRAEAQIDGNTFLEEMATVDDVRSATFWATTYGKAAKSCEGL